MKRVFPILTILFVFLVNGYLFAQTPKPGDNYPVPPKTAKSLFYVQRSHNKNTIVYDLNILPDGKIDQEAPIHPYWIRYEEGGVTQELSFIQRKYCYGLDYEVIDASKGSYKVFFVCYSKKYLYLLKSAKDNKYHTYISINNKMIELSKVFVKTDGGTFWFPVVRYVEISGIDVATNTFTTIRFVP